MPLTFPCIELKVSQVVRTPSSTTALVRLYRVDDGGLDQEGRQLYTRTLKRERLLKLDAGWDEPRLLTTAREKVKAWALEEGFNLPDDRLLT